jgi:hypothetical protein
MALHPVPPQHEPAAAVRQMVTQFRSMYVALVQEGFTPVEAVMLIGYVGSAYAGAGSNGDRRSSLSLGAYS